jgi:GTPase involved in cell partitioning and DNA repair
MRVPEGGDGGADGDVYHVVVEQDLDQSPEGPKANLAIEGKPGSLTLFLKFMKLSLL